MGYNPILEHHHRVDTMCKYCRSIAFYSERCRWDNCRRVADAWCKRTLKLARPSLTGGGWPLEGDMMHYSSTYRAGRNILLISQFMSLFPLTGQHEGRRTEQ